MKYGNILPRVTSKPAVVLASTARLEKRQTEITKCCKKYEHWGRNDRFYSTFLAYV